MNRGPLLLLVLPMIVVAGSFVVEDIAGVSDLLTEEKVRSQLEDKAWNMVQSSYDVFPRYTECGDYYQVLSSNHDGGYRCIVADDKENVAYVVNFYGSRDNPQDSEIIEINSDIQERDASE